MIILHVAMRLHSFISSLVLFSLFAAALAQAQPRGNLALFRALIDSSLSAHRSDSASQSFTVVLPSHASILENDIRSVAASRNARTEGRLLNYTVESASLTYPELFRDGFLGDYFFRREITLKGTIGFSKEGKFSSVPFTYRYQDTVKLEDKGVIENEGFLLGAAELPAEPIFESLMEPLIAGGAMAVTVYLLFTVRKTN